MPPVKLSKDKATVFFTKLFEGIDSFFQLMQKQGVEYTDDIIEAIEGTPEEKQLRLDFINSVYMAKKTFKRGMESLKQKAQQRKNKINTDFKMAQETTIKIKPK